MSSKKTLLFYVIAYLPAFLWALLIFYLSAQPVLPGSSISTTDFIIKKTGHITVYAVLWWLVNYGISKTHPNHTFAKTWLSLVIVFLYALSDEFHQSLVPNRHPGLRDVGYDMLGAGIAWLRRHNYI
jgi:VanZ family protein